jgi:hypothetical protein
MGSCEITELLFHSEDPDTLFAANLDGFPLKSIDGGNTFSELCTGLNPDITLFPLLRIMMNQIHYMQREA